MFVPCTSTLLELLQCTSNQAGQLSPNEFISIQCIVHHGYLLHKTVDFSHVCKINYFICSGDTACPLFDNHHICTLLAALRVKAKGRMIGTEGAGRWGWEWVWGGGCEEELGLDMGRWVWVWVGRSVGVGVMSEGVGDGCRLWNV